MYKERFLKYLKLEKNYSDKTVEAYRSDLVLFEQFLKETDNSLDLLSCDRDLVRLWIVDMMERGSATTTVNRKLSTLRSFYRYMRLRGILETSPVQGVKGPKTKNRCLSLLKSPKWIFYSMKQISVRDSSE